MALLTLPIQPATVHDSTGDLTDVARGPVQVTPLGDQSTQFAGDPLDLALIAVNYVGIKAADRDEISRLVATITAD